MAAAAPSPLASSVEKTNGAKLSTLLIDGGTTVLRNVFDGYHPPANLAAGLNANYVTLNKLFSNRVLHKPQWDLLFPPGGATPDSKTFDITLLFLLLTNICGLSPPLSGWHKPPPSSDSSLEANLTRIKLYRNEVYGHVTSTGVQTAVFNAKWREISTVLVALGLNQTEVVRLKSAPCGEDYISAVIEWVKSDEEIKSQLEELSKTQQKARQMQEEDHKTLQGTQEAVEGVRQIQKETKEAVEGVRQIHKDTQEAVEGVRQIQKETKEAVEGVRQIQKGTDGAVKEVLKTQQEVRQSEHERHTAIQVTQQAVEYIRQINQDTHQVVKEVLKTQQEAHQIQHEDHSTLQFTQQTVEDVRRINLDTNQAIKDVLKTQQEVHAKQQETGETLRQTQLEDHDTLQELQSKTQQILEDVVKTQEQHCQTFNSLKEGREAGAEYQVLQNLAKSEFIGDIEYLVARYQEGTREWVFKQVENWLDDSNSENRVMVISSNAGMGKSVIAAVICKRMQEAGRLSGSHFCQHNNARYRNPQLMLQSLACHLCHALPEYKQALVTQLSRNLGKDLNNMGVEELFALLFKEPLSTVAEPGGNMLMVIDGLDESDYQERNELLEVLAKHLSKLPCWIRFLCTTRPERNIAEALKHLKPFQLEPNDDMNMEDIKRFIGNKTQYLIKPEKKDAIVEKLVEKSEGLMLYAFFLVLFIEENKSVLDQGDLADSLPLAISSAYHSYFKRLENELKKEVSVNEENFLNLLSALIASREPMPIDFVSKLLGLNCSSTLERRKVRKAISCVSSLLPIRDDCLHVIHKSVKDWLTDASCYVEHDFTIDEKEGHRILASLCADELDQLKRKCVHDAQFSSTEKYALHHGVRHMLQLNENVKTRSLDECVQTYVTNLELLYAKLCVNYSTAAEEILWLQSQELSRTLSENSQDLLNTLLLLLRKYFSALKDHPHVFFQAVVNEGGPVLSSKASNMLQNKYPEIPYMEVVNKHIQKEAVLARFRCSSKVVCFDVSAQLHYMVCECDDRKIQLWSLRTGELLWTRPVKVEKNILLGKWRVSSSLSLAFYRSIVFHPTEDVVLPGVLSHGYDFHGDLQPLFPESNCSFTVCSISVDKTTMLTNCLHNDKCIIMWSLENGSEITRTTRDQNVLSFAWSRGGKLLAISHGSGRIDIVDVVDGFRTLGQTNLHKACGVIRFSPDSRSLLCHHFQPFNGKSSSVRLNINITEQFSLRVDVVEEPFVTQEFESPSEGGFLLGDSLSLVSEKDLPLHVKCAFVLDEHTVLKSDDHRVDMLDINEQQQNEKEAIHTTVVQIAFSLRGENIYVVSRHDNLPTTVTAWNVSSNERIAEKEVDVSLSSRNCLLAVKGGVLIITEMCTLQMWNLKLSECIWCWTNIGSVTDLFPVSEERVACTTKESKVIILDSTSREILSTIQIGHNTHLLACNSKFHILTNSTVGHLRLSDHETTLWEKQLVTFSRFGRFSPAETFVIGLAYSLFGRRILVLDALSGKTLHVLGDLFSGYDFGFVSDEECVSIYENRSLKQRVVQLFNVKSGVLLSNLPRSILLNKRSAASSCKGLVAIYSSDSECGYELIQVRLPGDEESRRSKWTLNPEEHRKVQEGKQEVCSCVSKYNSELYKLKIDDDDIDDNAFFSSLTRPALQDGKKPEASLRSNANENVEIPPVTEIVSKYEKKYDGEEEEKKETDDETHTSLHINPKTLIKRGEVSHKGDTWNLQEAAASVTFCRGAETKPLLIACSLWSPGALSPPLGSDEVLVSNVIELLHDDPPDLEFSEDAQGSVSVALMHSAYNLKGYEVVIKQLVDPENNEWIDLETDNVWHTSVAVKSTIPSWLFPCAEALCTITRNSSFAAIWRLKSFSFLKPKTATPEFICTVSDYPDVSVSIPWNSVPAIEDFSLTLKVQEPPSIGPDKEGILVGPVLHISSLHNIKLLEPAKIQIPLTFFAGKREMINPLSGEWKILHYSKAKSQEWTESTDQLVMPPVLADGIVTFHVNHFSWFWPWWVEKANDGLCKLASDLYKRCMGQNAGFLAYLCDVEKPDDFLLMLSCFPANWEGRVKTHFKTSDYVVDSQGEGKSEKPLCKNEQAFVSLSEEFSLGPRERKEDLYVKFLGDTSFEKSWRVKVPVKRDLQVDVFKLYMHNGQEEKEMLCKLNIIQTPQRQVPSHPSPVLTPQQALNTQQRVPVSSEAVVASTSQKASEQQDPTPTLEITLLADEWASLAGGLSTFNRELAIHLAAQGYVKVTLLVPENAQITDEHKNFGITVVKAKERPGYDPHDWLSFPPHDVTMDVVIGHGMKLGRQGQVLKDSKSCKWVQMVHTAQEQLGIYKSHANAMSKAGAKHEIEVSLCKRADLVVPVGLKLAEAYSSCLRSEEDKNIFVLTPGLFKEFANLNQCPNERSEFKVLLCGRSDSNIFELKGYDIAVKAFADKELKEKPYRLLFVGAPDGKEDEVASELLKHGIAKQQLTVRKFINSRDKMKELFCEVDLAIMPSKTEGFGLIALEALSAGLPILASGNSGFAKAFRDLENSNSYIVDSKEPKDWAEKIKAVRENHGEKLQEIRVLRESYGKKYSWEKQCKDLVEKLRNMVHGKN